MLLSYNCRLCNVQLTFNAFANAAVTLNVLSLPCVSLLLPSWWSELATSLSISRACASSTWSVQVVKRLLNLTREVEEFAEEKVERVRQIPSLLTMFKPPHSTHFNFNDAKLQSTLHKAVAIITPPLKPIFC